MSSLEKWGNRQDPLVTHQAQDLRPQGDKREEVDDPEQSKERPAGEGSRGAFGTLHELDCTTGSYRIYRNSFGQIILDPMVTIPAYEAWLFKNNEATRLKKSPGFLQHNPKHPSLQTHPYTSSRFEHPYNPKEKREVARTNRCGMSEFHPD